MSEPRDAAQSHALPSSDASERTWVLDARGLSKSYGARHVVTDVSLQIARGEGLALLGPNGAGKTTLLSMLAGVLRPDAGSLFACGRCISQRASRSALAFVPQQPSVYDELTVAENITLFARLHGLRARPLQEALERALEITELANIRQQRASACSGGMRRRLSLACALVHSPSLLLLDEPFEGVDDESRAHLLEVLAASKRGGVALVLSTHRLDEVGALCERFALLRAGRVIAERTIGESAREDVAAASRALGVQS